MHPVYGAKNCNGAESEAVAATIIEKNKAFHEIQTKYEVDKTKKAILSFLVLSIRTYYRCSKANCFSKKEQSCKR